MSLLTQLEGGVARNLEVLVDGDLVASEVVTEAGLGDARREGDQSRRQPHCDLDAEDCVLN